MEILQWIGTLQKPYLQEEVDIKTGKFTGQVNYMKTRREDPLTMFLIFH